MFLIDSLHMDAGGAVLGRNLCNVVSRLLLKINLQNLFFPKAMRNSIDNDIPKLIQVL